MGLIAPRLSWPIVVAGDGDTNSGMTHLGQVPEATLAAWLGRASLFALPARYEPFGLLPVEAALAGCALVLGDIPSLREVWGAAADFVVPDDPESVRMAIEHLIASPATLAARAQAAHRRALEFSPARMAQQYAAVYGSATGRTDVRRRTRCAS
jgi:glycosyltransferase involved in cell wall biosynthesis